jgi:hypothetical protein
VVVVHEYGAENPQNKPKENRENGNQMAKSAIRRFLFDSAYQVVTWIWIGFSIGAFFYYLSKNSGQGVLWSVVSLACSAIVMIVLIANQHFGAQDDQERPELFVEQVIIEPFQVGKPETVSLIFRNRGKIVAEHVSIETTHAHKPKTFDGPLVYDTKPPDSVLTIGPDSIFTVVSRSPWVTNATWIQEIINGDRLLFVYGKGHYEDRGGTEYPISFCYMYEPSLPRNMVICPTRFLPTDKPKPEAPEPLKRETSKTEETPKEEDLSAPASRIGGTGAPSQQLWPNLPHPTPYDHLRWTDYTEDYFYGAIWRWQYRPEMGDREPRNIFGYCPDCNGLLRYVRESAKKRKPDGLFSTSLHCDRRAHKSYLVRSASVDPIDGIRALIREKLQSEAWREVVKQQLDARDGRV